MFTLESTCLSRLCLDGEEEEGQEFRSLTQAHRTFFQTFVFLTVDKENVLKHPRPYKLCQHNENQKECNKSNSESPVCPTESDLKYKLAR